MSTCGIFSYKKTVIKEGSGKVQPNEFSDCCISLNLQSEAQLLPDCNPSYIGYKLDEETTIVVGQGTTHAACIVDLCVQTMFEGELSLLEIAAACDLHSMSFEDKVKRAVCLKEIGTSAFVAKNTSVAFHKFSRSLKYLTCAAAACDKLVSPGSDLLNGTTANDNSSQPAPLCNSEASIDSLSSIMHERVAELMCHCWLNLAACQLRYQNYKLAAINCSTALEIDSDNIKGLFRRAQCNLHMNDEHAAVTDLEHALTLEPGNQEVLRLLSAARKLSRQSDDRLAAAMSKMFS